MRIIACTGLTVCNVAMNLVLTIPSARSQSLSDCQAAINAAQQRIDSVDKASAVYFDYVDISDIYKDFPVGRPYDYRIGIEGDGALAILNSPAMAAEMAGGIFENCSNVGIVSFGLYRTGIAYTLGWSPDGDWIEFQCTEDPTEDVQWGFQYCM